MTKRRKFLIGMGSLVAGGAAAVGTGATQYSVNERSFDASVTTDDSGIVALSDTSPGDIVQYDGGELGINFGEASGSEGINIGAEVMIGDTYRHSPDSGKWVDTTARDMELLSGVQLTETAFQIVNQAAGQDLTYTITYELNDPSALNENGSFLAFVLDPEPGYGETGEALAVSHDGADMTGEGTFSLDTSESEPYRNRPWEFSPGEALGVAVYVNTDQPGSSVEEEDLSGKLTIEAHPV